MFGMFCARSVVEDKKTEHKIDKNKGKYSRLEDIWEGLKWLLARSPELGEPLPGKEGLYVYKTPQWKTKGAAMITALYSYSDDKVVIHDILIRENGKE